MHYIGRNSKESRQLVAGFVSWNGSAKEHLVGFSWWEGRGRGRGERGEDGAGSCSARASELLGRFIRRVSTAVIACTTLITETQNNQLWVRLFHTDSFAFIRLCMEISRLVFNSMRIQAMTQWDNKKYWDWLLLEGDCLWSSDIPVAQEMTRFL